MRATLVVLLGMVPASLGGQTRATIYQDGRVIVHRVLPVPVPAGTTTLRLHLPGAELPTIASADSGVRFITVVGEGSPSDTGLLRRAVGTTVLLRDAYGDTARVLVRSVDPIRLEYPNGAILTSLGAGVQPLFDPAVLGDPGVTVVAAADRARADLPVRYQTDGASWQAHYTVRIGGTGGEISGLAEISNETLTLEDAAIELLAGQIGVGLTRRLSRVRDRDELALRFFTSGQSLERLLSQPVGGHSLYRLAGSHRLSPGRDLIVPLFAPVRTAVERLYVVDVGEDGNTGTSRVPGGEQTGIVSVQYRAPRPRGTAFGDASLPPGSVAIYEGAAGREVLVGEGWVAGATPGEPLVVTAGLATEVRVLRRAPEPTIVQDSVTNASGAMSIRAVALVQSVEWRFHNGGAEPATFLIIDRRPGRVRVVESTIRAEDLGARAVGFRVTVPAGGDQNIRYRIRIDR